MNSTNIQLKYPSVTIVFANNEKETNLLLDNFTKKDYTFINYTESNFQSSNFDQYSRFKNYNTHRVIGQEFNNVVMLMDNTFKYNDSGKLTSFTHPNPDYLYVKLLYQGLTRVREKLVIIIIQDYKLFQNILSILQ